VGKEEAKFRQETLSVVAKSGVLHLTRKQQRERIYTFRNKSTAPKTVLVLQNLEEGFSLTTPEKPAEKTAEEWRFSVSVPAGETKSLKVVTQRPVSEQIALFDADVNVLVSYAQNAQLSEKLRGALKRLVELRRAVTEVQELRRAVEEELKAIDAEQARIRQNMQQLDRNSALYQQYVKKLQDQEKRIEELRAKSAALKEQEAAAQKAVRAFTDEITAE
jgi:hypothetical protein